MGEFEGPSAKDLGLLPHEGPRSKEGSISRNSTHVEGILASLRNRPEFDSEKPNHERQGIKTSLFDLLDVVRSERLDARTHQNDLDAETQKKQVRQLNGLEKAVWKLAFHEEVSPKVKDKVLAYVGSHMDTFGQQILEDPDDQVALTNQRIFGTFRNLLHGSSEDASALQEARALDSETAIAEYGPTPLLPQFELVPDKAAIALTGIGETPTPTDLQHYFVSAKEDVSVQTDKFKESDAWKEKAEVVKLALGFYGAHKEEPNVEDRIVYVVKKADGQISSTWELKGKPAADTKIYAFTLNGNLQDPNSLWTHAKDLDHIETIKDTADKAVESLEKLQEEGVCSDEEFYALYVTLETHQDYLEKEKPEGYEESNDKLDAISAFIREKQSNNIHDEVWYVEGDELYEDADQDVT